MGFSTQSEQFTVSNALSQSKTTQTTDGTKSTSTDIPEKKIMQSSASTNGNTVVLTNAATIGMTATATATATAEIQRINFLTQSQKYSTSDATIQSKTTHTTELTTSPALADIMETERVKQLATTNADSAVSSESAAFAMSSTETAEKLGITFSTQPQHSSVSDALRQSKTMWHTTVLTTSPASTDIMATEGVQQLANTNEDTAVSSDEEALGMNFSTKYQQFSTSDALRQSKTTQTADMTTSPASNVIVATDKVQHLATTNGDTVVSTKVATIATSPTETAEIMCTNLGSLSDGTMNCTDANAYSSTCSFRCNQGFFLNGSSSANCSEDDESLNFGSWSSPLPQCIRIECPSFSDPSHGNVSCDDSANFNSNCSFTCHDSYRLIGQSTTTCIDDDNGDSIGTWTNAKPHCKVAWITVGGQYKYVSTNRYKNFRGSRHICQSFGGDLAHLGIKNSSERKNVSDALGSSGPLWIGGEAQNGSMYWLDGSIVNKTQWDNEEPSNLTIYYCLVAVHTNDLLHDDNCTKPRPGLCETSV